MPCCGEKRSALPQSVPGRPAEPMEERVPTRQAVTPEAVYFAYVGKTGLTVQGPITGRRYRFDGPGAVIAVDRRDGPSLAAVPNLRRANYPSTTSSQ